MVSDNPDVHSPCERLAAYLLSDGWIFGGLFLARQYRTARNEGLAMKEEIRELIAENHSRRQEIFGDLRSDVW